jgi:type IV secretory pathway VirB4 component
MTGDDFSIAARRERPLAQYIPFSSLVADDVVMTRDGTLLATLSLAGVGFETEAAPVTDRMTDAFNRFLTSLSGEPVAVHAHRIRRRFRDSLAEVPGTGFAADFTRRCNRRTGGQTLMACELYLTLAMRTDAGGRGGLLDSARRLFAPAPTLGDIGNALSASVKKFRGLVALLESTMADYGPRRLAVYRNAAGNRCSAQLTFYNFLNHMESSVTTITLLCIFNLDSVLSISLSSINAYNCLTSFIVNPNILSTILTLTFLVLYICNLVRTSLCISNC